MPTEPLALSTVRSAPLEEADYDAICSAMTATARGRWFLEEYARRNRNCDTNEVLAAIARMETAVVDNRATQATQEVRIELLEMARTIAQTRADVTAGRSGALPAPAAEPTSAPATPDIAAAAERLRQIAWTVRACGIELPASEQIEQVAEAILSAGVLHTLGEQQTARLTEVLHYLEHRVDRMLDNQLAAAAGGEPAPAIPTRAQAHDAEPLASSAPDFPLAMVDMTAANTNEAEPVPARLPIVEHSAQEAPAPVAAASPVELPTPAVISQAEVAPAMEVAPVMEVAQQASPTTTQAPEPAASAPAIAATETPAVAPVPSPTARAPVVIAPKAEPEAIAPQATPEPVASKATAPMPAASAVTAAAARSTVLLGDQPAAGVVPDAIAAQVDDDLNELTDFAAPETTPEEDPADFLFEAPPGNAASVPAADELSTAEMAAAAQTAGAPTAGAPTASAPPGAKVATAQMSTVLAAIATELLTNGIPETQVQPLATSGALAAVMAMSEEERIALFS